MKENVKTAGEILIGGLIAAGFLFYLSPPGLYIKLFNICLWTALAAGFYFEWRKTYYPNYGIVFKLYLVLALLEIFTLGVSYDIFGWHGLPRLIILVIADVINNCLLLGAIYLFFWNKPNAKRTWAEMTADELVWGYVWQARIWKETLNSPEDETEKNNKAYDMGGWAYLELRRRGEAGVLVKLLTHKDEGVRVRVARDLLWTDEKEALLVLEGARNGNDELAKVAGQMVEYWKAGKIEPDKDPEPTTAISRSHDRRLFIASIIIVVISFAINFQTGSASFRRYSKSQISPTDIFSTSIASVIAQHASPILHIQAPPSNPSWWIMKFGYQVFFYSNNGLTSVLRESSDTPAVRNAYQELTQFATQRLMDAGFKPDPSNSATSTANGPFFTVRSGFISSDGAYHCVIIPPVYKKTKFKDSSFEWAFTCANTQDIAQVLQEDTPFLDALGSPTGVVVSPSYQEGDFANVSIFGEGGGIGGAIVEKDGAGWKVIWKTTPQFIYPPCSLVHQYSVPKSVYEVCLADGLFSQPTTATGLNSQLNAVSSSLHNLQDFLNTHNN